MSRLKKSILIVLIVILIVPSTLMVFSQNNEFRFSVEDISVFKGEAQLYQVDKGTLNVVATITNYGEPSAPIIIAALCEGTDRYNLIRNLDYKNDVSFLENEQKEISFSLNCTNANNKFIKIFVYDNLKFQNALAKEATFPTGKEAQLSGININGKSVENFKKDSFNYNINDAEMPLLVEVEKPISAIEVEITYPKRLPGNLIIKSTLGDKSFEYQLYLTPYMNGTLEHPYCITNKSEFDKIGTGDYTLDKVYKITEDIGSATEPITTALGSTATPFSGKLIGDKESGFPTLYFDINQTTDYQGLTAVLTGTVENIVIAGKIIGRAYVGGVAGWMKGGVVKGVTNQAEVSSSSDGATGKYIGGIVGSAETAKNEITNCINEGAISLKGYGGGLGGIIGYSNHADNHISSCVNKGVITYTGSNTGAGNIGGIVGYLNYGTVELCANKNTVTVTRAVNGVAGGIAGLGDGTVLKSYNSAAVTSPAYAGGISGSIQYGRIVNIIDCYNTGTVTATGAEGFSAGILPPNKTTATTTSVVLKNTYNVGVVIGANNYFITGNLTVVKTIEVANNFYLNTLTGKNSSSYSEQALTEQELKNLDLGDNWVIDTNSQYAYPQLAGFTK